MSRLTTPAIACAEQAVDDAFASENEARITAALAHLQRVVRDPRHWQPPRPPAQPPAVKTKPKAVSRLEAENDRLHAFQVAARAKREARLQQR